MRHPGVRQEVRWRSLGGADNKNPASTWTPRVCTSIAFWPLSKVLGHCSAYLLGPGIGNSSTWRSRALVACFMILDCSCNPVINYEATSRVEQTISGAIVDFDKIQVPWTSKHSLDFTRTTFLDPFLPYKSFKVKGHPIWIQNNRSLHTRTPK